MAKKALIISVKEPNAHKKAAEIVKSGGIIICPTETVYGFAGGVFDDFARQKIYSIKGRNYKKPLVIMAGDINSVKILAEIPQKVFKLIKHFWPGRLTLIFNTTPLGKILSGGRNNIGIRIPDHKFMLDFLKTANIPLWTTSVNISGKESAKSFKQTLKFAHKVDAIVDGGNCQYSFESTVIDVTSFPYTVIRKGSLDTNEILKRL
ncbi:MAG: threonylcarbamoyl-AMP synthase [Elusimicrobiota bacterium]|nr:threonylcarbamoyl-AMP synthase [Elusimicrobiota bacterium]